MQIEAVGTEGHRGQHVTGASTRLIHAAHEFEGQMMKELLQPLTDDASFTGDSTDPSGGSTGLLGEYATEALGQAISQHGGFGIADHIVNQITHSKAGATGK